MSILDVGDGVVEVRSTSGDGHLGGDDFDKRIVDWLADEFKKDQGIDLRNDPQALQRLYEAAERAKVELSSTTQAQVNLPFITADASGPKHLNMTITRAQFEQLTKDLIERTRGPVEQALSDAKLSADDIDEVILVGGSTRIPAVQDLVRRLTRGKDPNMTVNPDEVVAIGAALQAGVLKGEVEDVVLLDVTPLSLGPGDPGRRDDQGHRAQHDDPGAAHGDVLHRRGQPDRGRRRRPAGRARARRRQPPARPLPPGGHPAGAAWRAADRGHFRHRLQRHPQRLRQGPGQRPGADGDDLREHEPRPGRDRADGPGGPGALPGGPAARARRSTLATSSTRSPTASSSSSTTSQDRLPVNEKARAEQLVADARQAISERAGLDRVRPLIADLEQIVARAARQRRAPPAGAGAAATGRRRRQRRPGRRDDEEVVDAEFTRE